MAAQTSQPAVETAKAVETAEAVKTAKAAETAKGEGVTLYHADGREKVVTDPSVIVDLEFNGWSRTKPKSKK